MFYIFGVKKYLWDRSLGGFFAWDKGSCPLVSLDSITNDSFAWLWIYSFTGLSLILNWHSSMIRLFFSELKYRLLYSSSIDLVLIWLTKDGFWWTYTFDIICGDIFYGMVVDCLRSWVWSRSGVKSPPKVYISFLLSLFWSWRLLMVFRKGWWFKGKWGCLS